VIAESRITVFTSVYVLVFWVNRTMILTGSWPVKLSSVVFHHHQHFHLQYQQSQSWQWPSVHLPSLSSVSHQLFSLPATQ